MKFNLLYTTVALSAVMAVPSQMNNQAQNDLAMNAVPKKEPKSSGNENVDKARANARKYFNAESYRTFLLDSRIDFKIPAISDDLKNGLVASIVKLIHDILSGIFDKKIPEIYEENQAFIDEYVLDICEFYSKKSDRLPRYADALIAKIKDDPEIIDIIRTTILFNKGRFEGPHSNVDASILAKIKEKFPNVHAQYHEIRAKFNELGVIPPEIYAKYSEY